MKREFIKGISEVARLVAELNLKGKKFGLSISAIGFNVFDEENGCKFLKFKDCEAICYFTLDEDCEIMYRIIDNLECELRGMR